MKCLSMYNNLHNTTLMHTDINISTYCTCFGIDAKAVRPGNILVCHIGHDQGQ